MRDPIRYMEPRTMCLVENSRQIFADAMQITPPEGMSMEQVPDSNRLRVFRKGHILYPIREHDLNGTFVRKLYCILPDIAPYEYMLERAVQLDCTLVICGSVNATGRDGHITHMFGVRNAARLPDGKWSYDFCDEMPYMEFSQNNNSYRKNRLEYVTNFPTAERPYTLGYGLVHTVDDDFTSLYSIRAIYHKGRPMRPAGFIRVGDRSLQGIPGQMLGYSESYRAVFAKDGKDVTEQVKDYLEDTGDSLDTPTFEFFWEMMG